MSRPGLDTGKRYIEDHHAACITRKEARERIGDDPAVVLSGEVDRPEIEVAR